MDPRIAKTVASILGVPGFILLVYYLLFNKFGFSFGTIPGTWAAVIAICFLVLVTLTVIYTMRLWAPIQKESQDAKSSPHGASAPAKISMGSRVLIPRVAPRKVQLAGGTVKWSSNMNIYCGREAVVTQVSNDDGPQSVKLDVDAGENWWLIDWLTPVH